MFLAPICNFACFSLFPWQKNYSSYYPDLTCEVCFTPVGLKAVFGLETDSSSSLRFCDAFKNTLTTNYLFFLSAFKFTGHTLRLPEEYVHSLIMRNRYVPIKWWISDYVLYWFFKNISAVIAWGWVSGICSPFLIDQWILVPRMTTPIRWAIRSVGSQVMFNRATRKWNWRGSGKQNGFTVIKCLGGSCYHFFPVCRDLRSSMS